MGNNTNQHPNISLSISTIIQATPARITIPSHIQPILHHPINTTWNHFISDLLHTIYKCPKPTSWDNFYTILLAIGIEPRRSEIIIEDIQAGTYQDPIDHSDYIIE